jgi:hypothetical protein
MFFSWCVVVFIENKQFLGRWLVRLIFRTHSSLSQFKSTHFMVRLLNVYQLFTLTQSHFNLATDFLLEAMQINCITSASSKSPHLKIVDHEYGHGM